MKKKKFSVAKKILVDILENAADFVIEVRGAFDYPKRNYNYYQNSDYKKVKREIARLKREKFIEEKKRGDRLVLRLTEKGKKAAIRQQVLECNNFVKDKYYLVIFDIPETEKRIRDFFRSFLKEAGFIKLQQSVWLTKKEILKPLKKIVKSAKAEKWVHIITATDITNFSIQKKVKLDR